MLRIILTILSLSFVSCELRWCEVHDITENPEYVLIQYNDITHECISCVNESKVIVKSQPTYQCCQGRLNLAGNCTIIFEVDSPCNSSRKRVSIPLIWYHKLIKIRVFWQCDGVKHCYNGDDEIGCDSCGSDAFSCNKYKDGFQCIAKDKVKLR